MTKVVQNITRAPAAVIDALLLGGHGAVDGKAVVRCLAL